MISEEVVAALRAKLLLRYPEGDVDRALRWATESARGMADWVRMPQLYQEILPIFLAHAEGIAAKVPEMTRSWMAARAMMKTEYNATPFSQSMKDAYGEALDNAEAGES